MGETASFTPREAAAAVAEATRYEDALRGRTEGLTWMVWGLVSPAIWLSYGFAGAVLEGAWPLWAQFLWMPWVAAGVVVSVVLWRTASLAAPRLADANTGGWRVGLAWVVVVAVLWAGVVWLAPTLNEALVPLLVIGSAWTLFGAVNLYRCSRVGRNVSLAIGLSTLAVAVALAVYTTQTPMPAREEYALSTLGAVLASAIFPLAGGLWQATRG